MSATATIAPPRPSTDHRPRGEAVLRRRREQAILQHAGLVPKRQTSKQAPRMRVTELEAGRPVPRIELLVLRRYPRRHVASERYVGPVAAACGRDESGVVGLVLWDDQVDQVRTGDVIRVENGWCRRHDGQLVVSTGRRGRLSVLQA